MLQHLQEAQKSEEDMLGGAMAASAARDQVLASIAAMDERRSAIGAELAAEREQLAEVVGRRDELRKEIEITTVELEAQAAGLDDDVAQLTAHCRNERQAASEHLMGLHGEVAHLRAQLEHEVRRFEELRCCIEAGAWAFAAGLRRA